MSRLAALGRRYGRELGGEPTVVVGGACAVLHLGKPELEALGSILAGLALGVLALRTRSLWYGAFLHGVIAVSMDLLAGWTYVFAP